MTQADRLGADRHGAERLAEAQRVVTDTVDLPTGYSLSWSGQYEYMERAQQRLQLVVPLTLVVIVMLLFLGLRTGLVVGTLIPSAMLLTPTAARTWWRRAWVANILALKKTLTRAVPFATSSRVAPGSSDIGTHERTDSP